MKLIREYSIPLILGVVAALVCSNAFPEWYHHIIHKPLFHIASQEVSFHWVVNDLFMVLFFASAGIEIVTSLSKGGPLNPIQKAVTPLMATAGGILGPVAVFFILEGAIGQSVWANGWGITTATDIALAWMVAKIVFGKMHPAVSFLLLLAVADDAVGLVIIAVFYPSPEAPVKPIWLFLVVVAMMICGIMRRKKWAKTFWPYIIIGGSISWMGMHMAGIHPALSLVAIVPFLPSSGKAVLHTDEHGVTDAEGTSALHKLEEGIGPIVDYGLFFFGFSNAGVVFSSMSSLTWIVMISLIVGKTFGISLFTLISSRFLGFGLPKGMVSKEVPVAGIIAGMGLTVALFVTQSAYVDLATQGAAKMGALFSAGAAIIAIVVGRIVSIKRKTE